MAKIEVIKTYPALWEWIKEQLPKGLVPHSHQVGYGYDTHIELAGTGSSGFGVFGGCRRTRVATVHYNTINIYQPQWLSDIQDLAITWEKLSVEKVTLRVYEAATLT